MSSGYGLDGGPSRCLPFWQEVLACYIVNQNPEDPKSLAKCRYPLEDYFECLHHKKEFVKVRAMQIEYTKRLMKGEREEGPAPGEVRKLGLIPDQKPEDVHLKASKWIPHKGPSIS